MSVPVLVRDEENYWLITKTKRCRYRKLGSKLNKSVELRIGW
jgi:hypothetical protein